MKLIVHGGYLNSRISKKEYKQLQSFVNKIVKQNISLPIIDLVPNIIMEMESSGLYNAGKGSVPRSNSNVHLTDACFAINNPLKFGGVCGVPFNMSAVMKAKYNAFNLRHPLVYDYQDTYFSNNNFNIVNTNKSKYDTIGAMATDGETIVLAGSTGGLYHANVGRISDTCVFGCGYYIDDEFAILASGDGDAFIRANACTRAAIYYDTYKNPSLALQNALMSVVKYGGQGSLMMLTLSGEFYHLETNDNGDLLFYET